MPWRRLTPTTRVMPTIPASVGHSMLGSGTALALVPVLSANKADSLALKNHEVLSVPVWVPLAKSGLTKRFDKPRFRPTCEPAEKPVSELGTPLCAKLYRILAVRYPASWAKMVPCRRVLLKASPGPIRLIDEASWVELNTAFAVPTVGISVLVWTSSQNSLFGSSNAKQQGGLTLTLPRWA